MIGILVLSHGPFCEAIVETSEMIVKKAEQVASLSLKYGDNPELFGDRIIEAIQKIDTGEGVMIFTDLLGGTPNNQVLFQSRNIENEIQCVSGVNLPMVLEAIMIRESMTLEALAEHVIEVSKHSVRSMSELVSQ